MSTCLNGTLFGVDTQVRMKNTPTNIWLISINTNSGFYILILHEQDIVLEHINGRDFYG